MAIARQAPKCTAPLQRTIGEVLVRLARELGAAGEADLKRVRRTLTHRPT